jgi:dTDP-4-dehydrorhamnose 3,5-epimerase
MRVTPQAIPDVLLVEPKVFGDPRGYFFETYSATRYAEAGIEGPFVQDNVSRSRRGILRGLHLQHPHDQGKLVFVLDGEVLDVAVDVRVGSPTFGRWVSALLSSENKHQLWVPPGFAHGFCVTSEHALFAYKCTDLYSPEDELGVAYDDSELAIPWPVAEPLLSDKDRRHPPLSAIAREKLPRYAAETTGGHHG